MSGPRNAACVAWDTLRRELDTWSAMGTQATFWWRDDDATVESAALAQLDELATRHGVGVAIAVIPADLDASLARYLAQREHFSVLQHGFAHRSYAAPGVKKIEMGGERSTADIEQALVRGREILSAQFPAQYVPVLVPPWNRVEKRVLERLPDTGLMGLSSMWTRKSWSAPGGLVQVNTHLDPVNWRHGGKFIGEYRSLAQINSHLIARRQFDWVRGEATGILTHHLDQDGAGWEFCDRLISTLSEHPAVVWTDAREIWNRDRSLPKGELAGQ